MKNSILTGFLLLTLHGFTLSAPAAGQKDSSSVAFAMPVMNIVVDGDTTDWDGNSIRYPLAYSMGAKDNRSAFYRAGYDPEKRKIFFLVVVRAREAGSIQSSPVNPRDMYTLYLDRRNLPRGSGVIGYSFNAIEKVLSKTEESWDPGVRQAGWDGVQTACRSYGAVTVYECSVAFSEQLVAGKVIGIDHLLSFSNGAGNTGASAYLSWTGSREQDDGPGKLGYLVLLKPGIGTGRLSGTLKWKDPRVKGFPGMVRVVSVNDTTFNLRLPVDSSGAFSAILPGGRYRISPLASFYRNADDLLKIDGNTSVLTINVPAENMPGVPALLLETVEPPSLVPEKGLLHGFDKDRAHQLDAIIKSYQDYYLIPGVSLALIRKGKVIYHKSYGVKNAFTGEPVTDSTLFEAASVTKTVFAFAVNSLAEQGVIDLDKPLYQYLPFDEIASDDRYKLITARHVLSHQTGLPNWAYNEPDGKLRLKFTPGTGYGYSGEGFEYLKRVVEKITGKDIEAVVNEEVIKPLGLKHIYFTGNPYLERKGATGHYENSPTRTDLPEKPGMAWSMYTNAVYFTRFMLALQNREKLKPATYDEMFRFQSTVELNEREKREGLDIHYGLGLYLESTPYGLVYGHGGNNGDFQCQYLMFRDLDMGFVIFTNSSTGGTLVHQDMRKILVTGEGF